MLRQTLPALAASVLLLSAPAARAQEWPDLYATDLLLDLHLQLPASDWNSILNDGGAGPAPDSHVYTEHPAQLWATGEAPIQVAVRRKRSTGLPSGGGSLEKVSLKIDIDQYLTTQDWHGVTKLSLENGGEGELVREGLAWVLHGRAGYGSGMGNWVRLHVNGQFAGLFTSAEAVGKRFLRNRLLHEPDQTWLYKHRFQLKVGGPGDSPVLGQLCFEPFDGSCAQPSPAVFASETGRLIDMPHLLAMEAVNAFVDNPDSLFSKPNNYYFADWSNGRPRKYYPWDLDTLMHDATSSITTWGGQTPYITHIVDHPTYRPQWDGILAALVQGPFSAQELLNLVDLLEITLTPSVLQDPNAMVGPGEFDDIRDWLCQRVDSVRDQLGLGGAPACASVEDCGNGPDDDGDGAADCADSGCATHPRCQPEDRCFDGIDDDLDGQADCVDLDCLIACFPEADCGDGVDDNGNGLTDCDDPSCAGDRACPETNCVNGLDDDADGQVDCDDVDCVAACNPETDCTNGVDDDVDGAPDCFDSDCASHPQCAPESNCADGQDDDLDGQADCLDPDCASDEECQGEWSCTNGLDDDADGDVDCADLNCAGDPACTTDRDGDGVDDVLDCAPDDGGAFAIPPEVLLLAFRSGPADARLEWPSPAPQAGVVFDHDVVGGRLGELHADRGFLRAGCVAPDVAGLFFTDSRVPGVGDGYWYMVRGDNACGSGPLGGTGLDSTCP